MPLEEIAPPLATQLTLVLLVPLTVAVNCWLLPASSEVAEGEMTTLSVVEGELGDAATVNHMTLDFFWFCVLSMSTEFFPALARSVAEMVTLALAGLTTVVGRLAPFHVTVHARQKLRPVTCSVKPALPAVDCAGESAVRTMEFTGIEGSLGTGGTRGIVGSSARESDTTKVRKTNKTHHLVTGILLNPWFISGIVFFRSSVAA
jgi:hypothetical protein